MTESDWNVDICAAVLSDKPPQLPLREELNSLGFEVVLGASGTGEKAAKEQSKRAVEAYRWKVQARDLRKRRLFPMSPRKIQGKLNERKRNEDILLVPHACSYESYDTKLNRNRIDTQFGDSEASDSSRWKRRLLRKSRRQYAPSTIPANKTIEDFPDLLFLAPDRVTVSLPDEKSSATPSTNGTEIELSKHLDEVSSSEGKGVTALKFESMHIRDDVPEVFGAFDNLEHDSKDSTTTGGFDGTNDKPDPPESVNPFAEQTCAETTSVHDEVNSHGKDNADHHWQQQLTLPAQDEAQSQTQADGPLSPFDRATAQICQAAGINLAQSAVTNAGESNKKLGQTGWMSSAKHVLENISSEVFRAATFCDKRNNTIEDKFSSEDDVGRFVETLTRRDVSLVQVQRLLDLKPELPQLRRQQDGRLPLHALCDKGMPDRSTISIDQLTKALLQDIEGHKNLIQLVVGFYPAACLVQDKREDLPVHLLARRLMEWEAVWYEKVYTSATKDSKGGVASAISKLYHAMSEAIEMVLMPLATHPELCRAPGSMGTILPLHIASIFTASVKCLRLVLEAYPEAASKPCDLGILQTFVPDECLALELHDNLSTDFPKWEIAAAKETNARDKCRTEASEEMIRRSDLLFAYNPIEPHRFENSRIRRLESRIQYDAIILLAKNPRKLDPVNARLWLWMCTFREPESGRPTYLNNVKRIVSVLPPPSLRYLLSVDTPNGNHFIVIANPECVKAIRDRLKEVGKETEFEVVEPTKSNRLPKRSASPVAIAPHKDFVGHLCRLVFNVPDTQYPTSFIILPYRLGKAKDGTLQLASPTATVVAAKFASCLVSLTDPQYILDVLSSKWTKHFGRSIYGMSINDSMRRETSSRLKEHEVAVAELFTSGSGYFYLIDEVTGLPRADEEGGRYPFVIQNPIILVRELLPLMLMGMVQMRGDKSVPKLAEVFLNPRVAVLSPSWVEAAEHLQSYLGSHAMGASGDLARAREALRTFKTTSSEKLWQDDSTTKNKASEWENELAILKGLMEIHDPARLQSGLHSERRAKPPKSPMLPYSNTEEADKLPVVPAGLVDSPRGTESQPFVVVEGEKEKKEDEPMQRRLVALQRCESIDVIELSRKMDALAQFQNVELNANGGPTISTPVSSSEVGEREIENSLFEEEDHSRGSMSSKSDASYGSRQEENEKSSYSLLFNDLALRSSNEKHASHIPEETAETRDEQEATLRIWNSVDRVWEDVSGQLNSRAETFCEDTQILQLKVDLANQAKALADLGRKVSTLRSKEHNVSGRGDQIVDLTNVMEGDSIKDSLSNARKLVLRMGDLEDRLVCDEIKIQHLSMEAYSVEHEGDEMITKSKEAKDYRTPWQAKSFAPSRYESPVAPNSNRFQRELSRLSWGTCRSSRRLSESESSFLLYERNPTRIVDFDGMPEFEPTIEIETGSSSYGTSSDRAMLTTKSLLNGQGADSTQSNDRPSSIAIVTPDQSPQSGFFGHAIELSDRGRSAFASARLAGVDPDGNSSSSVRAGGTEDRSSQEKLSSQAVMPSDKSSSQGKLTTQAVVFEREEASSSQPALPPVLEFESVDSDSRQHTELASRMGWSTTEGSSFKKRPSLSTEQVELPLTYNNVTRKLATASRSVVPRPVSSSHSMDKSSYASFVFRPLTSISVPRAFPAREFSGLSASRSSSDLALDIERLIDCYNSTNEI